MTNYAAHLLAPTPQTQPLPLREQEQVVNNAGGYVFRVDPWQQLRRFLIIGAAGGTYYAGEKRLTLENTRDAILPLIQADGQRVVRELVDVSTRALALKADPGIFVLALACAQGNAATKAEAYKAIKVVCRTGTHLFHFCEAVNSLRGWSRGLRTGVANWYTEKNADQLEYQLIKYRQRDGWTHKDVLRLAHPKFGTAGSQALAKWAVGKDGTAATEAFARIAAFEQLQKGDLKGGAAAAIVTSARLPWEAVPTELLNDPIVLDALFDQMPLGALTRNLNRFTKAGLINNFSAREKDAVARLTNAEEVRRSKMHPIQFLLALKAYSLGRPITGKGDPWRASLKIVEALDDAFYLAFENIVPAGVPTVLALDVSGSMSSSAAGTLLSAREASTAMALATVRTEPQTTVMGFSDRFVELPFNKRTSLHDAIKFTERLPFQNTNCAMPFIWAKKNKIKGVGNFAVYTDSETYVGNIHPTQALAAYREYSGTPSRSVVCATTSTGFTIADPKDPGMLDVAGFGADTPATIAAFARGEV